jgi:hypothetical protein
MHQKKNINNYFNFISYGRIFNCTKFPNGIFDLFLNKMNVKLNFELKKKIILVILRNLPYI